MKPLNMRTATIALLVVVSLSACKKEDDDECPTPMPEPSSYSTGSYAPYTVGSWWVYTGVNIAPGSGSETPNNIRDSIYVAGDSIIDGRRYAHLLGERFGSFAFDRWVGIDGPRLVMPNGTVLLDVTAVSDTLDVYDPGSPVIDSVAIVLKSQSLGLTTPAGIFVSDHGREQVFYMASGFPSPLFEREHYVAGVGIAVYTSFYATSGIEVQMRLADYHIEE